MMIKKTIIIIVSLIFIIILVSCKTASIIGDKLDHEKLVDGLYQGHYKHGQNKATVEVTIKNNKIVNIVLTKHDAWKGHKADEIIPQRILEQQSTKVDAVSGATNSSHVIMNAVQKAVEKASRQIL